jgi:hypothetical protein
MKKSSENVDRRRQSLRVLQQATSKDKKIETLQPPPPPPISESSVAADVEGQKS